MAKGKTLKNQDIEHSRLILTGMWLTGVLVRFLLALIFRHGPSMVVDESLYTNIARSLAAGEGIAYRSQPVPYMYIFYPLLLVPLYLFRLPFDLYRLTQLWNAVLMNTAVFPMFLFAKDYTKDRKKALLCTSILLLMPDMVMVDYLMSECVIWPLSMWLIFFSWKLTAGEELPLRYGVLTGVVSALMFWTKPGSAVMGTAILLVTIIIAIKEKEQIRLKAAGAGLAVLAGMIIAFYLLYVFVFGYEMSVLGLYEKQLTEVNGLRLAATAESSLLQILLFAIACAGVYFVFPYAYYKEFPDVKKHFIIAISTGLVALAIGTAALVDMLQWGGSFTNIQLHLRYMAMYVPLMFVLSQDIRERKEKSGKGLLIALIIMTVLIIFPGAGIGFVEGGATCIDSVSLSAYFKSDSFSKTTGIVLTVLTAFFVSGIIRELSNKGISRKLQQACVTFFVFFLLFNNVCAYLEGNNTVDKKIMKDAREANRLVEEQEEEVLGITQKNYADVRTYWEESQLRKPMQQTTIENLIYELDKTQGVYYPFVPVDQAPNKGNHNTPDTNTFLLGETIAEHIELNENVTAQKTENGIYTLVHAKKEKPLADTMLYGLDKNLLTKDSTALLLIFDESRYEDGGLTVIISASARAEECSLRVTCGSDQETVLLSKEMKEYEFQFENGQPRVEIEAIGGNAEILTYRTE